MAATPKPERMRTKRYRPPNGKNWIGVMVRGHSGRTKKQQARYDRGFWRHYNGCHDRWSFLGLLACYTDYHALDGDE